MTDRFDMATKGDQWSDSDPQIDQGREASQIHD